MILLSTFSKSVGSLIYTKLLSEKGEGECWSLESHPPTQLFPLLNFFVFLPFSPIASFIYMYMIDGVGAFEIAPHSEAAYLLRALEGDEELQAAPMAYVARLFDGYADEFDRELVQNLNYRGPAKVYAAVVSALEVSAEHAENVEGREQGRRNALRIIDLGCGTGLSGIPFRALAKQLIGVDLSSKMLAHARKRRAPVSRVARSIVDDDVAHTDGLAEENPLSSSSSTEEETPVSSNSVGSPPLYDELLHMDVVAALQKQHAASVDIVVAADVCVYVGDLEPIVAAASTALRTGGVLAFTTEAFGANEPLRAAVRNVEPTCLPTICDGANSNTAGCCTPSSSTSGAVENNHDESRQTNKKGWVLQPSGRFAHSAEYIRSLLAKHGFHGEPHAVTTRSDAQQSWVVAAVLLTSTRDNVEPGGRTRVQQSRDERRSRAREEGAAGANAFKAAGAKSFAAVAAEAKHAAEESAEKKEKQKKEEETMTMEKEKGAVKRGGRRTLQSRMRRMED